MKVLVFGPIADALGAPMCEIFVRLPATVEQVTRALVAQMPGMDDLLLRSVVAVNQVYAGKERLILEGDEVALIPPVSGG